MSIKELIEQKIKQNIDASLIIVRDDSHKHAGHAPVAGRTGETHFHLQVRSAEFAGLSRVAISRRIHQILAEELAIEKVHALTIDAKAE